MRREIKTKGAGESLKSKVEDEWPFGGNRMEELTGKKAKEPRCRATKEEAGRGRNSLPEGY